MLGKEKILQIIADDEIKLIILLSNSNDCPKEINLTNNCNRSCYECWELALKEEVTE